MELSKPNKTEWKEMGWIGTERNGLQWNAMEENRQNNGMKKGAMVCIVTKQTMPGERRRDEMRRDATTWNE
eukprot:scaffold40965_cov24-Prasinocladus_malaysianus.AAC.1